MMVETKIASQGSLSFHDAESDKTVLIETTGLMALYVGMGKSKCFIDLKAEGVLDALCDFIQSLQGSANE